MALNFDYQTPRLTLQIALAAATVLTLKDAIIAALSATDFVRDNFADVIVADQAARLALTPVSPYFVAYQTDNTTFYLLKENSDPSVNANWTALAAAENVHALVHFIGSLSWYVRPDSYLVNKTGGADMYILNKFMDTDAVPVAGRLTTYGILIAAAGSRNFSGRADQTYIYSLAGTNLLIDFILDS